MSRLVVVSNRVTPITRHRPPWPAALRSACWRRCGERGGIWFGWSGEPSRTGTPTPKVVRTGNTTYVTIDLLAMRSSTVTTAASPTVRLWPLSTTGSTCRASIATGTTSIGGSTSCFAEQLLPDAARRRPDLGARLPSDPARRGAAPARHRKRIGFFLHIPFPSAEVYVALPCHDRLMRRRSAPTTSSACRPAAICAISTTTCIARASATTLADGLVHAFGRTLRAQRLPDRHRRRRLRTDGDIGRGAAARAMRLARSLLGRKLIIGVDRLDYSKGIPERLRAYERSCASYTRQRGQVTLRADLGAVARGRPRISASCAAQVEQLAGRINGRFGEFDWTPVRYLNRSFTRRTLAGFFRLSRGRPGDAAARRHEPGRQGICRRPVATRIPACWCCRASPAPRRAATAR